MSKAEEKNQKKTSEKKDKKEKSDKKQKKEKREGEPKKPQTAYFLFCAEKRKENTDKKLSAIELGEMYTKLSDAEKDKYKKMHDESMKKYEEEMALFKKNNPEVEKEEEKKKAKPSKDDQKKNNKKACNCGSCDECKKKNKQDDE